MTAIAVVAKQCVPGRVKTRLTPPLTPEQAAAVAQASLDMVLAAARACRAGSRILFFEGEPPATADGFTVLPQPGGGLDARLAALFDAVEEPLLLVGMDTPQAGPDLLDAALDALRGADAVLGPAVDGGFWALGMRRPRGDLIRGVPMSTAETGSAQRARLVGAGLTVAEAPPLVDVDTVVEARSVAAMLPGSPFAAAVAA